MSHKTNALKHFTNKFLSVKVSGKKSNVQVQKSGIYPNTAFPGKMPDAQLNCWIDRHTTLGHDAKRVKVCGLI